MKINAKFQSLIPPLSDEEFKQLEENILQDGIRDSLVVWNDTLIDGHNRYKIAEKHGLKYTTVSMNFDSEMDAERWIILNQFGRRNLEAYVRSTLALKLKSIIAEQAKKNMLATQNNNSGAALEKSTKQINTRKELANIAGVSENTIAKVEKIEAQAPQEVKEQLSKGEISINQAYKGIKEAEKQKRREEKKERKSYTLTDIMPDDVCKLFASDIRDGLPDISDSSVDYIITDPPYSKEFISLYGDLSQLAARVLKPGGSLITMTGQSYLPEVITELSKYMTYHWCLSYLTPGGQSPQLFHKRVNTFWKPVLWFIKDKYNGDYVGDVLKSSVNDNDKRFHEWGQSISGMKDIVERFTNPGDLILDPFLGGGTTGVVTVSTGRKFIGVDINKDNINTADSRIKEVYTVVTSERRKNRLEG